MITKRDKQIIKFVEVHGSITINQCAKMFFRTNKEGYDQARKRLRVIYKMDLLKRYRKNIQNEVIYSIDKPLKIHDIKLIDVFANLSEYKLLLFKKEYEISFNKDTNYRVDAVAVIGKEETAISFIIEIDYTHFTNIKKIKEITYGFENKTNEKVIFIIVKIDQQELEIVNLANENKYFILPWSLAGYEKIFYECLGLATEDEQSS